MIKYSETKVGDRLRVVGAGAPGFAANGEYVEVVDVNNNQVRVKNREGETARFTDACGAARLEK